MRPPVYGAIAQLTVRFTQAVKPILDEQGAIVSQDNLVRLYAEASAETFHDDMKARAEALREQKQREALEKRQRQLAAAAEKAAKPKLALPPKPGVKEASKSNNGADTSTSPEKPKTAATPKISLTNVNRKAQLGVAHEVNAPAPVKPARTAVFPSPRPAPTTPKSSSGARSKPSSTVLGVTPTVASPSDEAKVLYRKSVAPAITLLEKGNEQAITRDQMFWVLMVANKGSFSGAANKCDRASAQWLRDKNRNELLATGKHIQIEAWAKYPELVALGEKCLKLLGDRTGINLLALPVSKQS